MVGELIQTVGLTTFVLLIVGLSLMVVVVLFMSYFKTLVAIANFAYPNAKFRAQGDAFVRKEEIKPLLESKNIKEVYSTVREKGYSLPKEATEDMRGIEKHLERSTLEFIERAGFTSPEATKPLVKAWLVKYDVKMVKKAVRTISSGLESKEEIKDILTPVKIVDEEMIENISSARSMQELFSILGETEFDEVLSKRELENDFFRLDLILDRFAFQKLREAVLKVESDERSPVNYFIGKYTDIFNLKMIFRALGEDVDADEVKDFLLPSGWELDKWKLEQMVEAKNVEEALVELEGTAHSDLRQKGISKDAFEGEKYLDQKLLSLASELSSRYILRVGPLLKYLVVKEFEVRNLKILIRGLREEVPPEKIEDMMILEGNV